MQSKGFYLRYIESSILIFPSLILLFKFKDFKNLDSFYKTLLILFLLLIPIALLTGSTTISDRLFLYTYPLQLFVINFLLEKIKEKFLIKLVIIVIAILNLIVWFTFGYHKSCWIPYKNILLLDL
jgi:hypothetical protein